MAGMTKQNTTIDFEEEIKRNTRFKSLENLIRPTAPTEEEVTTTSDDVLSEEGLPGEDLSGADIISGEGLPTEGD